MAADRLHLTIGEVLSLLREEFPDVSISKIRFLESQGLVDPERTPSGYRKFYDHDVERLRWILQQQREHFLPLKVIRGRLAGEPESPDDAVALADIPVVVDIPVVELPVLDVPVVENPVVENPVVENPVVENPVVENPVVENPVAVPEPPAPVATPEPPAAPEPPAPDQDPGGHGPRAEPDVYTVAELAREVGCEPQLIVDLQQYGILVAGASVGGTPYFDPGTVAVARIGARFSELGVEPRHLRTWRNAADREASLFEQLVMPLLRQRNPQARLQAAERLEELASLGGELRAGLITEAVRAIR